MEMGLFTHVSALIIKPKRCQCLNPSFFSPLKKREEKGIGVESVVEIHVTFPYKTDMVVQLGNFSLSGVTC